MGPQWRWNPQTQRAEFVSPEGSLIAVYDPSGRSAVPEGVMESLPPAEVRAAVDAFLTGTVGQETVDQAFGGLNQRLAQPALTSGGQPPATAGMALSVEQRRQLNNQNQSTANQLGRGAELDQAEHRLRTEMAAAGVNPDDFFRAYPAAQPVGGQEAYPMAVTPSPGMADQLQRGTDITFQLANQERAGRLQQIENAWGARKAGIERLQARQGVERGIAGAQQGLALAQQQAMRDPATSRQQIQMTDARGNIQFVPPGAVSGVAELDDLMRQRDVLEQQADPLGYQERRRRELTAMRERDPRSVPEHVAASWGLPGFAEGGQFWGSGGENWWQGTQEGGPGANRAAPSFEAAGQRGEAAAASDLQRQAQEQQRQQRRAQMGLEGEAVSWERQQQMTELDRQAQEMEQSQANWRAEFSQAEAALNAEVEATLAEIAQSVNVARARAMAQNPYAAAVGMGLPPPPPIVTVR